MKNVNIASRMKNASTRAGLVLGMLAYAHASRADQVKAREEDLSLPIEDATPSWPGWWRHRCGW